MEKIKARVQGKKNVYIHNDLSNAALHFKTVIEEKLKSNDRAGIAFDYMACLVMVAFTFEAKINFLGHKFIQGWNEWQRFDDKVKAVLAHLKINPDWNKRPYSSIKNIQAFRNSVAHGKPVEVQYDETVVVPAEELDRRVDLSGEWQKACSPESVNEAYDDVETVWRELLKESKLSVFDTMTRGQGGITFIEKVVDA
jgi:hypothetical protein